MRVVIPTLLIVVFALVGDDDAAAGAVYGLGQSGCKIMSEDDSVSLELLRKIGTSSEPAYVTLRESLQLPVSLQASEVAFVNDSTTCVRAHAVFDSVLGVSEPTRVVAVFQLRDVTVVTDSSLIVEGWHLMMFLSPQWQLLGEAAWP